jgi:hypothetical protein
LENLRNSGNAGKKAQKTAPAPQTKITNGKGAPNRKSGGGAVYFLHNLGYT